MFTRRKQNEVVPEVGAKAPEFNLPSAQGGQLRLSMRTVRGPVVVAFYRPGNEEDVGWFKALAEKEQEINMASGSVVGIGVAEPDAAREFARASGLKSYLLYDYARVTSPSGACSRATGATGTPRARRSSSSAPTVTWPTPGPPGGRRRTSCWRRSAQSRASRRSRKRRSPRRPRARRKARSPRR
jgi:peroxiredoxin